MPQRSKKPCAIPGCPVLVSERWCEAHSRNKHVARPYDQRRGSSASRGYDSQWARTRLVALRRDSYLCQHCLLIDRPIQATDVDHIIPIAEAPERRLDLENLQSLCKACHQKKTIQDNNGWGKNHNT